MTLPREARYVRTSRGFDILSSVLLKSLVKVVTINNELRSEFMLVSIKIAVFRGGKQGSVSH